MYPTSLAPGAEIGYAEITSSAAITATSDPGDTVITAGPFWFDGGPVLLEVFASAYDYSGALLLLRLYEGSTHMGRIFDDRAGAASKGANGSAPIVVQRRFTPTQGLHTYTIKGQTSSGTAHVVAGAGSTTLTDYIPAFARFTKV